MVIVISCFMAITIGRFKVTMIMIGVFITKII